jgi:hypothetical protein
MKSDCRLFVIINLCIVFVTVFRKIQIKKNIFHGDRVASSVKLLAILKVPSDIVDIVSLHRFKKQVSEPIASSLGKYVCFDKNVALLHKIGPILSLHRCRKILVSFFLSLHR